EAPHGQGGPLPDPAPAGGDGGGLSPPADHPGHPAGAGTALRAPFGGNPPFPGEKNLAFLLPDGLPLAGFWAKIEYHFFIWRDDYGHHTTGAPWRPFLCLRPPRLGRGGPRLLHPAGRRVPAPYGHPESG